MAAAQPALSIQDQLLAHTVYYDASQCPIKDDLPQLAVCWKSGAGPLTKQEAGLLLWYHSRRGEDGCAEVLGTGVLLTCLDVLDSSTALQAEKSTAAGLLLSLCTLDKGKEQVARSKASGANGGSCCSVLHSCLRNPEAMPRHVMGLLASLASNTVSLSILLKALAAGVPWSSYVDLLKHTHKLALDHQTAIETAQHISSLVAERAGLALSAASASVLEALLAAAAAHKSAAAVSALCSCMLSMCSAAPDLRERLGQLPGAIQRIVDLLGPPPSTIIAWEQQQLKLQQLQSTHTQSLPINGPGPSSAAGDTDQPPAVWKPQRSASSVRTGLYSAIGANSQHGKAVDLRGDSAKAYSRSGSPGPLEEVYADGQLGLEQHDRQPGLPKTRRKSLRILDAGEVEAGMSQHVQPGVSEGASLKNMRTKSQLGSKRVGSKTLQQQVGVKSTPCPPPPCHPPLGKNSAALKWATPVPEGMRAPAAGLLALLVQLPDLRRAASDHLAAPRLVALLRNSVQQLSEAAGKKGKTGGKKSGSKLAIPPDAEQLLVHICVGLQFLVASDNADCFRVAAGGCLPDLVRLAGESSNAHLRLAAKAVLSQVMLLAEARQHVQLAEVPGDMVVLQEVCGAAARQLRRLEQCMSHATCTKCDDSSASFSGAPSTLAMLLQGTQSPLRLRDAEIKLLLLEFPGDQALQLLDDVSARARV